MNAMKILQFLWMQERNFVHRTQGLSYSPQGHRKIKPASTQAAFTADDPTLGCDQLGDLVKLGCLKPEFYKSPWDRACRRTLSDDTALLKEKNCESTPVCHYQIIDWSIDWLNEKNRKHRTLMGCDVSSGQFCHDHCMENSSYQYPWSGA